MSKEKEKRSVTLVEGQPPIITGTWAVGEILGMARSLAAWVEQLPMAAQPSVNAPVEEVGN